MSLDLQPHDYSRRVLLCVTGLSPQIVTETLYGLAVQNKPAFMPTEVHLISTAQGARTAELLLFDPKHGQFWQLLADYQLPAISAAHCHIHTIPATDGQALDDIRNLDDNRRAADEITERVRLLTADPDAAVHVSIAGGRKTMGFYLGYALSLYGRVQDRLSHVLVSPDYEGLRDFFYPTPDRRVIMRERKPLDTREATVDLAEIPFVRLREELPKALLEGRSSYSDAVSAADRARQPVSLVVDLEHRRVIASGIELKFTPQAFVVYTWLLKRRLANQDFHRRQLHKPEIRADLAGWAEALYPEMSVEREQWERAYRGDRERWLHRPDPRTVTIENRKLEQWWSERIQSISDVLAAQMGSSLAQRYRVQVPLIDRGRGVYGIDLPSEAISGLVAN